MARLSEAVDMAKEKLGEGLVSGLDDASISIDDLQVKIINLGEALGKTAAGSVSFADKIISQFQRIQDSSAAQGLLNIFDALVRGVGFIVTGELVPTMDQASARLAGKESLKEQERGRARLRAAKALGKAEKDNAANKLKNEKKITDEKAIQAKLDKAALALGKGTDVFDLDKIQVAAAILAKQQEIDKLGTAATEQQKLALANDAQRLTVKQLMLDLEDAIADKDADRATSLANQLNKELSILATMQNQTIKLSTIENILNRFKPKDLINLDNLDAAIRKLNEIMGSKFDFLSPIMPSQDRTGINDLAPDITSRYVAGDPEAIRAVEAHADAISMLAESELALADALFAESIRALDIATASVSSSGLPSFGGFDPGRFRMGDNITVNVNAGVVGSEDTIALAVQRAILDLERKGDPLRYTGGL
jgi:hypothetical protein